MRMEGLEHIQRWLEAAYYYYYYYWQGTAGKAQGKNHSHTLNSSTRTRNDCGLRGKVASDVHF
jgi:hypothetical protein